MKWLLVLVCIVTAASALDLGRILDLIERNLADKVEDKPLIQVETYNYVCYIFLSLQIITAVRMRSGSIYSIYVIGL